MSWQLQLLIQFPPFLFALVAGLLVYDSVRSRLFRFTYANVMIGFLVLMVAMFLRTGVPVNNQWLYNGYIFSEMLFLLLAAEGYILWRRKSLVLGILISMFSVVWLSEIVTNGFFRFTRIAFIVECISILLLYFAILIRLYREAQAPLYMYPVFWICCAYIIYFSCSVPYFSSFKFLEQFYAEHRKMLHLMIVCLQGIRTLLTGVAFLLLKNQTPTAKQYAIRRGNPDPAA